VAARNVGLFGQLKLALTGRNMAMEILDLVAKCLSALREFVAPRYTPLVNRPSSTLEEYRLLSSGNVEGRCPMPERHNKFVRAENIKGFQRRLGAETDPEKRALIAKLLAEEEAMMRPHPIPSAPDREN
jgi:hypothetical protein